MGAACGGAAEQGGRVRALVVRLPKDTIRFEAPARASRCSGGTGSGLLVRGSVGGNGVAVWLRAGGGDSLGAGPWPLLQRGDTLSPRGVTVGVRFMVGDVAHGLPLDSGAVDVRQTARVLTVAARGTGLETATAASAAGPVRVALDATFDAVPLGTDTVSCRSRL